MIVNVLLVWIHKLFSLMSALINARLDQTFSRNFADSVALMGIKAILFAFLKVVPILLSKTLKFA